MRILITSDIHANLVALQAVLKDIGEFDAWWNAGDAVGYGPQPAECVAKLCEGNALWVAGNHERAATGAISVDEFNPSAAAAALWTGEQLSTDDRAFLDALPETAINRDYTLVHGSLRWPIWEYLDDEEVALGHLALQTTPYSIVGHTHVPMVGAETDSGCELLRLFDGDAVRLDGQRAILNPGSVGQPRDGDRRASYAALDTDALTFTVRRVEYDIPATQRLMQIAGLPEWLIERLEIGR